MKLIPLNHGLSALVDDENYDFLVQWKWYAIEERSGFYAVRNTPRDEFGKRKRIQMHSAIINPPEGMLVDHIHGNTLDNRRSELRIATHSQNMWNQKLHKNNSLGFKGIRSDKRYGTFSCRVQAHGKRVHLGTFREFDKAVEVYVAAVKDIHGEFARLS